MTTEINRPRNFALRKITERRAGKLIPEDVMLEVTYRCNLRCIHCGLEPNLNTNRQAELTFSEIARILDQVFEIGALGVTFTGGEVLCRPDILDIVDYTRDRGLFWGIKTNGTLLTDAVADRLKRAGVSAVHVSLYGATEETHDRITGVGGSYKKSLNAIRILKSYHIPVVIFNSVMKSNFHELVELGKLASQLEVQYNYNPLICPKNGEPGSADRIRLDDEQLRQFAKMYQFRVRDEESLQWHLLCSAARTKCAVSPEGDVYPCSIWRQSLGNLKQLSFRDIWNSDAARAIRETKVDDFQTCKMCEFVHYCGRCRGLVYMENSDISGPSPENCRLARAIKGVISDDH